MTALEFCAWENACALCFFRLNCVMEYACETQLMFYFWSYEHMYHRHALATCRWQWYISDQNTVTKYQPLQSTCKIHVTTYSLFTKFMSFAILYYKLR